MTPLAFVPVQWCGCGDEIDSYGDRILGLCSVCADMPDRVFRNTELRDGPRYAQAVRYAREVRTDIWKSHWWHLPDAEKAQRPSVLIGWPPLTGDERERGIPVGWLPAHLISSEAPE